MRKTEATTRIATGIALRSSAGKYPNPPRPAMRLCGAWEGGDAGWAKELEDNAKAVDFFNHGESPAQVTMAWSDLGLTGKQYVRDLWRQQDFGTVENDFIATVPRPGVALVRISKRRENQLPLLSPMPIPFQKQSNIS